MWCSKLGEIHDDELDLYMYGPPDGDEEDMRCDVDDHRPVYAYLEPEES